MSLRLFEPRRELGRTGFRATEAIEAKGRCWWNPTEEMPSSTGR